MSTKQAIKEENSEVNYELNADASGEVAHEVTLFAEPVFHIGDFNITNSLFTSWFVVLIIGIVSFALRSRLREVPSCKIFEIGGGALDCVTR